MVTAATTRVRDLDTARPGIRFVVILGHAVALSALWLFGWIESMRPPVPPPLEVTLLAPAAVEKLESEIDRPFPLPPPAKPDAAVEPAPPPSDVTEPPPGDTAVPPVAPEDVPDINVDDLLPPPEPEPQPVPVPVPVPVPPEPVPPEPSPREPDITEVVQPPLPKPKPVEPKPEPKPVPPAPQPKPKPVPPKPVQPLPKPKPQPPVVVPKPVPLKPPPNTVKKPTPAEVEAEYMARIRDGLITKPEVKPAPQIATLPPGMGKTLTAKEYEERISAQIRNSVAPMIKAGADRTASPEQTRDFYAALSRELYRLWQQPSRLAVGNARPVVRVSLTILADGTVQGKHISGPSRVSAMDGSVETVLRRLSRVPAPSAYGNRNPSVTIEVAFELLEDH